MKTGNEKNIVNMLKEKKNLTKNKDKNEQNDKKKEKERNDKQQKTEQKTEKPKLNPSLEKNKNENLKNFFEIIEGKQDSFYRHFLLDTAGYIPENISLEDYLKVKEYLNQNKQYSIDDAKNILKTILALEAYNKSYNFCNDIERNRINRKTETILMYLFNDDFSQKYYKRDEVSNNKELQRYKEKIIEELEINKLDYEPILITKDKKVVFAKKRNIENFLLKNKSVDFIKNLMSLETFITKITGKLNESKNRFTKLAEQIDEIEKEQDIAKKVEKILNCREFNSLVYDVLMEYIEEKKLFVLETDSYILRNKYQRKENSHKILELKNLSIGVLPENDNEERNNNEEKNNDKESKIKELYKIESIFISPYVNYRENKDEIFNNNNKENNFINYLKSKFDLSKEFIEPEEFDVFEENSNDEEKNNYKELDYFLQNKKFQRFTAYQKLREILHQGIFGSRFRNKEIISFLKEYNMGNLILKMSEKELNLKKYFIDNLIDQYDVFDVDEKISTDLLDIMAKDEKEKYFIQNEIKGYLNNIDKLNQKKEEIFFKYISQESKLFKFIKNSIKEKSYQDFFNYLLINSNSQTKISEYEDNLYNLYKMLENDKSFFNSFEKNYAKILEYYEEYKKEKETEKEKNKNNIYNNFTEFLIDKVKEELIDKKEFTNKETSNFLMLITILGTDEKNKQELENMLKKINNFNKLKSDELKEELSNFISNKKISFFVTNKDYLNILYEKVKKLKDNLNKFYFIEKNQYSEIMFEKTLNEYLQNISFNFHKFSDVYNKINNNFYSEESGEDNNNKRIIKKEIRDVFRNLQNIIQQDFYVPFDLIYENSSKIFFEDIIKNFKQNEQDKVKQLFEIFFDKLASTDYFNKIIKQYKEKIEQKKEQSQQTAEEELILDLIDKLENSNLTETEKETVLNNLKKELVEYEIKLLKEKKSSILFNTFDTDDKEKAINFLNNIIFSNPNNIEDVIFKRKIIISFYEKEIEKGLSVKNILLKNIKFQESGKSSKKLNDNINVKDIEKVKPVLLDNLYNFVKEKDKDNEEEYNKNNFILDKMVEIAYNINFKEIKDKEHLIKQIKNLKENMNKGNFTLENFIDLYIINNLYKIAIQEYDNSYLEKEEKTNLENSLKNEIDLLLNFKISKRMEEKYPENENFKEGTKDVFKKIEFLFKEKEEYYKKILDSHSKFLDIIYERNKTNILPNSLKEDEKVNNFLLEIKSYLKNKELTIKDEINKNKIKRMNVLNKEFLEKELHLLKNEMSLNNRKKVEETKKYLNLLAENYQKINNKLKKNTELFSKVTNDYLYKGKKHIEKANKYKEKITEFLTREKKELIPIPFKEKNLQTGKTKKVNIFFERDELEKTFKHLKINNKLSFKEQINEFLKDYQNQLQVSNIEISEDGFSKRIKVVSKDNQVVSIETAEITEEQKKRLEQATNKELLNNLDDNTLTDNWQRIIKKHKDDLMLLTYWEEDYKQNYQLLADKKQSLFERYQNNLERKLNEIPSYRGGLQSYMTRVFFPFLAIIDAIQAVSAYIEEDLKYQKEKNLYLSQIEKNMLQSKRELNKNIEKTINSKKKVVNEVNKLNKILTKSQNINDLIIELYKEKDNSSLIKSLFLLDNEGQISDCSEIQEPAEYCKKAVIYKKNGKLIFNNENFQKRINEVNDILNGSFMQDNSYKKIFSLNLILERLQTEFVEQNSKIKLLGTNWGGLENFLLSYNKRESMIIDKDLNIINNYVRPTYSKTFSLKKIINSPKALLEILTDKEKTNNLLSYLDKEEKNKVLKMIDEIVSKKLFDLTEKKQSSFNEIVKISKNEFELKRIFNEPVSEIVLLKNDPVDRNTFTGPYKKEDKKIVLKTTSENKNLFEYFLAERNNLSIEEVIDRSTDELEVSFPNIYNLENKEFFNNNKKQIISTFKNLNLSFISENIEKEKLEKFNDEKILNFLKNGNIKDLISDLNIDKKEEKKIEEELKKNRDKILQIIFDSLNLSNKKTFKIKELKKDLNKLKITENFKNKKNNIFSLIENINNLLPTLYFETSSKKIFSQINFIIEQVHLIEPKTSKEKAMIQFLNDIKILTEKANNPKEYKELLKVLLLSDEKKTKISYLKDLIKNSNLDETTKKELTNLNETDKIINKLQTINNLSAKKILNEIDNFSILDLYNKEKKLNKTKISYLKDLIKNSNLDETTKKELTNLNETDKIINKLQTINNLSAKKILNEIEKKLLVYKIEPSNVDDIDEYYNEYIRTKQNLLNNYKNFLKENIPDYMDRQKFIKKYSITPKETNKLIEQSKKFIISKIKKQIDTEKILEQNKNKTFVIKSIENLYKKLSKKEEKENSLIQTTKFLELINKQTKDKEIIKQLNQKITFLNKNSNFINNEMEIDKTIQEIIDKTENKIMNSNEKNKNNVKIKGIEI